MSDPSGVACISKLAAVGTTNVGAPGDEGRLCGVTLHPGSAASSVKVYAGQTATGDPLMQLEAPASGASVVQPIGQLQIPYANGLTIVVAGTGAAAHVYYKPLR